MAAENSCAAFYPGIAILGLPIPFHTAYLIFLLVHLGIAAWGISQLVYKCGGTARAACLAAISYPFSGYVLFQIYNPIFLISAAWLPWVIASLLEILLSKENRNRQSAVDNRIKSETKPFSKIAILLIERNPPFIRLGVFLALMVLGGDPQTAYHCVVIGFATWIVMTVGTVKAQLKKQADCPPPTTMIGLAIPLLVAIAIAFLLAAIQVIPTFSYIRVSERALLKSVMHSSAIKDGLRLAGNTKKRAEDTLVSAAIERQRSHWLRTTYDFSTPAYRWIEFIWPSFGGRYLPLNTRWLAAIFPEGRWWTPSLYLGLFPFLLAVLNLRFWPDKRSTPSMPLNAEGDNLSEWCDLKERHLERIRLWFSWVSTFSLMAALGWYGPAGILEGLRGDEIGQAHMNEILPPLGGVYWLLTHLLPGYQFFRYPSKWLVLATMGLSVLGGLALDRLDAKIMWRLGRILIALMVGTLCLLAIGSLMPQWWDFAHSHVSPDPVFGSFAAEHAKWESLCGLTTLAVVVVLGLIILRRSSSHWLPPLMIFLTMLDLALHNRWMVFPVDVHGEPRSVAGSQPPLRFWQKWCDYPEQWIVPSYLRIQELYDWERATSAVRWGSITGRASLESYGTLVPGDYYVFLAVLHEFMSRHGLPKPPEETLAILGAFAPNDRQQQTPAGRSKERFVVNQPRYCFLSHNCTTFAPSHPAQSDVWKLTELAFFPNGRPRGPSDPLFVESSKPAFLEPRKQLRLPGGEAALAIRQESCRIRRFQPGHVTVEAALIKPGIVVLAEQYSPGWQVRVVSQDQSKSWETSPLRVNRIMMGVALPPGQWEVTFSYRAPGLALGAAISGTAWLILIVLTTVGVIRAMQSQLPSKFKISASLASST